jgi:hypothetical protein
MPGRRVNPARGIDAAWRPSRWSSKSSSQWARQPEQHDVVSPQPQLSSFAPVSAAHIIAEAHPTPLSTSIAPVGQLTLQAPHSMHLWGSSSRASLPFCEKTRWGHTMEHIPHPLQSPGSYLRVFTA